jgi:hypothetical protein
VSSPAGDIRVPLPGGVKFSYSRTYDLTDWGCPSLDKTRGRFGTVCAQYVVEYRDGFTLLLVQIPVAVWDIFYA